MEPDYEWNNLEGDKMKPPTHLFGAFGKELKTPLDMERVGQLNEKIGTAAKKYVEACAKANKLLEAALPEDANERTYAEAFLYYNIHLHQEETGQKVVFVSQGQISDSWQGDETSEVVNEGRDNHITLVAKYEASKGSMRSEDLNRAFVVKACEDFVLEEFEKVGSRGKIRATHARLWKYVTDKLPFAHESWEDQLIPTLVEDGWVIYQDPKGSVNLLPYGSGVPAYDPDLGIEHPAWSRDPSVPWP